MSKLLYKYTYLHILTYLVASLFFILIPIFDVKYKNMFVFFFQYVLFQKHDVPVSAIPCFHYKKAIQKEMETVEEDEQTPTEGRVHILLTTNRYKASIHCKFSVFHSPHSLHH